MSGDGFQESEVETLPEAIEDALDFISIFESQFVLNQCLVNNPVYMQANSAAAGRYWAPQLLLKMLLHIQSYVVGKLQAASREVNVMTVHHCLTWDKLRLIFHDFMERASSPSVDDASLQLHYQMFRECFLVLFSQSSGRQEVNLTHQIALCMYRQLYV